MTCPCQAAKKSLGTKGFGKVPAKKAKKPSKRKAKKSFCLVSKKTGKTFMCLRTKEAAKRMSARLKGFEVRNR